MTNWLEYTVEIESNNVPFKHFRNFIYWLTPTFKKERAENRARKLSERYGLDEGEVEVYSRVHVIRKASA